MPKLNLGRVVGRDGGFGDVTSTYVNDGGQPGVDIITSGNDTAKNFEFKFKNLINQPATSDELDDISKGIAVQSSNTITVGGMSSLWAKIKQIFAQKSHEHSAEDITAGKLASILFENGIITEDMLADACVSTDKIADGAVTADKLAEHCVGQDQLTEGVWETLSQAIVRGDNINDVEVFAAETEYSGITIFHDFDTSFGKVRTIFSEKRGLVFYSLDKAENIWEK